MFGNLKKLVVDGTSGAIQKASNVSIALTETSTSTLLQALNTIETGVTDLVGNEILDSSINLIKENKDIAIKGLEKQFEEKTNLGVEKFHEMKKISQKIVNKVGDNIDRLGDKKGDLLLFINKEIKESEIELLSGIDLENEEQEEITNIMLIMVGLGLIVLFPALIPEIIGAIIDPIDIIKMIIDENEDENTSENIKNNTAYQTDTNY